MHAPKNRNSPGTLLEPFAVGCKAGPICLYKHIYKLYTFVNWLFVAFHDIVLICFSFEHIGQATCIQFFSRCRVPLYICIDGTSPVGEDFPMSLSTGDTSQPLKEHDDNRLCVTFS